MKKGKYCQISASLHILKKIFLTQCPEDVGLDRTLEEIYPFIEENIQGWASVLFKRTFRSLRSFAFFIKERSVLCVLLRSL